MVGGRSNPSRAGGFAQLGGSPHESAPNLTSASPDVTQYYWVGVDVVQMRNIREHKQVTEKGTVTDYVYPDDPDQWVAPTYLVLQKVITMPPLGETIFLNDWTYQRLIEQMPAGSLVTKNQGGFAISEYIKSQIDEGVPLIELTQGEFVLSRRESDISAILGEMDNDEILQILQERGADVTIKESAGKDKK